MNLFQQLRDWLRPSTVKCNSDLEQHYEAAHTEDQYEAHIPEKFHKVPSFEHLFNPILMVTSNAELIKGFRFQFGLPLSEYFTTSHAWNIPNSGSVEQAQHPMMMPTSQKPTYSFTTQLIQDVRNQQPYRIMMGKVDNEGKVDTILIQKLLENLSLKVTGSFQSSNIQQGVLVAELQLEHRDSLSALKFGQGHWAYSINQRVHKNLMLGFQYFNLTAQKLSFWSFGMKTFLKNHSLFANYVGIQKQYNLGYIIPIKKGTQFVAHYKYDEHEKNSTTILGFKQRYMDSQILATINSKGEVTTTLNFKNPSYSLKLCAVVDYLKEKYSFGYGITLGQSM